MTLQNNFLAVFSVSNKITPIVEKIDFWRLCIENDQPKVFEIFYNFLSGNKLYMCQDYRKIIIEHLKWLKLSLENIFQNLEKKTNGLQILLMKNSFKTYIFNNCRKRKLDRPFT